MRNVVLVAATALSLGSTVANAEPGGCLKYGAAGAVAGHMVHHGIRGFMAGCAVGMYRRHEYRKEQRAIDAGEATPAVSR